MIQPEHILLVREEYRWGDHIDIQVALERD